MIAESASVCRDASCRRSRRTSVTPNAATRRCEIEQPSAGQQAVAGLLERSAAERERLGDLLDGDQRERAVAAAAVEPILDRPQRRREPVAHVAEQRAIRLVGLAPTRAVSSSLPSHIDSSRRSASISRRYRLAACHRASRHTVSVTARGDGGVAVAIAANPRAEGERRVVRRQPAPGVLHQRRVERAEKRRHRVPQRLLEDGHPRARLVDRRGPPLPHLAGLPGGADLDAEGVDQVLVLGRRQVRPIAQLQQVGDALELLHQRPAGDLGRMRGEDQLDAQAADRLVQPIGRDAGGDEPPERLVARSDLRRRRLVALVVAATADAVMLLGDVGQIEKMREGAGHRQRLLHGHLLEDAGQRREVGVAAAPRLLRQRAHALDQLEDRLPFVPPQRLAEQLAQQPDVLSQRLR